MKSDVIVAPSILAADCCILGREVTSIEETGADWIHFDVMDGVFVPNLSFGLPVLEAVRHCSDRFIDSHLMITSPANYVERFCEAGADLVTIHVEADTPDKIRLALDRIHGKGKKAGLSIKPNTPASALEQFLPLLDLILIMTVEPGFGGQHFHKDMLPKIAEVKTMIQRCNPECYLEVDGGIVPETANLSIAQGANVLVAGSYFFQAKDRMQAVRNLRNSSSVD